MRGFPLLRGPLLRGSSVFGIFVNYLIAYVLLDPSVQAEDDEAVAVLSTPAQDTLVVTQPRPTSSLHLNNSRYVEQVIA